MKRFLLALSLLAVPAGISWAQPPQEIVADDTITLRVDQTRTFRFDFAINEIRVSAKGIAEAVPESDRTINIRGVEPGKTLLTAYGPGGRVVFRSNIVVLEGGDGLVKIYGQGGKDFAGFRCGELGCGRADKDLPPVPFSTITSETTPNPDGSSRTFQQEFRPRR